MTRKEIELLNGAVVTREQFEAIEEHEEVERVENNGISGHILGTTWFTAYLIDGEEIEVYFRPEGENDNMELYTIDYSTGAGNFDFYGTLDEAKKETEEGLCYTQKSVEIKGESGEVVACLPWYGVQPQEEDVVTESFGTFGFYGEWEDR